MELLPEEHEVRGEWNVEGSKVVPDEACERIKYLVENVLQKVAESPQWGAWEVLYQDPLDGRFWERNYPRGEMHGGGPPRLAVISRAAAMAKYGLEQGGAADGPSTSTCKCNELQRLNGAAGQEYARSHLEQVEVDSESWIVLYRCPITGWYWKRHYPHGEAHGGGAPEYVRLSRDQAERLWGRQLRDGEDADTGPLRLS